MSIVKSIGRYFVLATGVGGAIGGTAYYQNQKAQEMQAQQAAQQQMMMQAQEKMASPLQNSPAPSKINVGAEKRNPQSAASPLKTAINPSAQQPQNLQR